MIVPQIGYHSQGISCADSGGEAIPFGTPGIPAFARTSTHAIRYLDRLTLFHRQPGTPKEASHEYYRMCDVCGTVARAAAE
jgi:hypothetical protein